MNLEQFAFFTQEQKHYYTFACVGLKVRSKTFNTRYNANMYMYKQCKKHGIHIEEVWEDNHDYTYLCNHGVRFFIQRV